MNISEVIISCTHTERMLVFYSQCFDMTFKEITIPQGRIYVSFIEQIKVTFCPSSITGITAKDNMHQFTFLIEGIKSILDKTKDYDGRIMQELENYDGFIQAAIKDIDGNSIILK